MILSTFLSSLLSGGLAELADVAITRGEDFVKDAIKDVTGIDLTTEDTISADQLAVIKENNSKLLDTLVEDNRHEEKMALLELNTFKAENDDLARASGLHASYIAAEDTFVSRFVPIFTLIFVLVSLSLMAAIVFIEIPNENHTSALSVLEMLKVALISVISFYFGNKSTNRTMLKKEPRVDYYAQY